MLGTGHAVEPLNVWQEGLVDLSPFAGQPIVLKFLVGTDGEVPSTFRLDNINLAGCGIAPVWEFSGHLYLEVEPDPVPPPPEVMVGLFGSDNAQELGEPLATAASEGDGAFFLAYASPASAGPAQEYAYLNLAVVEAEYQVQAAWSKSGGEATEQGWLQFQQPAPGHYGDNGFWLGVPLATHTPSPTATPSFIPSPTSTSIPSPTATAPPTLTGTSTATATGTRTPIATYTGTVTPTGTSTTAYTPSPTLTATQTPIPRQHELYLPLILHSWPIGPIQEEVPAHAMPDLVAMTLTPSEAYPAQGEEIEIEIQVQNRGAVAAQDVSVVLFDGSQLLASRQIALSASDAATIHVPWAADDVGVHPLTVVVDPDRTLLELDRGDNTLSTDVVVAPQPPPEADFAVTDLEVAAEPDQPGMLVAVVRNNGWVAGQAPLQLQVDGQVAAEQLVGPVGPGESIAVELPWPTYLPIRQLTAEINPRYRTVEVNPEDNSRTLDLRPVADLRVEGLSVAAPQVESGQPRRVTLSFRVENAGRQAITTPFRTRIFPGGVDPDGFLRPLYVTTDRLAPGEITYVAKTVVNIPDAFDIRIGADADDAIAEADEENNIATARYENPTPNVGRWVSIGPRCITDIRRHGYPWNDAVGLLSAIAIHPTSPGTMYVGSARDSGVWKTTNGGSTWQSLSDSLPSLNVAALAIDPSKPSRVYLATRDDGVFRSEDGGIQWTHVYTGNLKANAWGGRLLVDPNNPARLYLATENGIRRSTDSGASWPLSLWGGRVPGTALVMDPSDSMTLYATLLNATNSSVVGIYRTVNGGDSWQKLEGCRGGRLPSPSADTKISLGMSGSRLYAAYKSSASFEVWRTTDIGCSIGGRHEKLWEKGWTSEPADIYGEMYVHSSGPNYVYLDGVSLRRSTDGGKSFEVVSGYHTPPDSPHVDNHGFASDPVSPNVVYTLGDGGIYRSNDRGKKGTWTFIGEGIANVEFYDHAVAATAPNLVTGGTQDNGTMKYDGASTVWKMILGGDGATVDIDPTNAQILYGMEQFADSMRRSVDGGQSFKKITKNLPQPQKCRNLHWQVHPGTPSTMLASCEGSLWRTTTTKPPADWKQIYTPPAGGIVRTTVDGSTDLYYTATNRGRIYAGRGGASWRNVFTHTASIGLTDIEVDRGDPATVYAAFWCGYGTQRRGRVYQLRRVLVSPPAMTDQDITSDLRRDVCVKTLAVDRMHPDTVYVGTQKGVYRGRSTDGGATWAWTPYSNGLPKAVQVRDLEVHPTTGVMRAATWGRSAYEVHTDFPIGTLLGAEGKVTMLRVHDVGTGYGPPPRLDVEVVIRLNSEPSNAFGFQLRDDANRPVRQGMLDLLSDAFDNNWTVYIDECDGVIRRVWLTKP